MGVSDENVCPEQTLTIERLAAGGRGVGHVDGRVWFVEGGLPGDRLRARTVRSKARFVEAATVAIEQSSPHRRTPPCPIQARCGGCPWMPLEPEEQGRWKRQLLVDALKRVGGFEEQSVDAIDRPVPGLGYRNRVELTLRAVDGHPLLGFHARWPGRGVVDVPRCLLQHDDSNRLLAKIRSHLKSKRKSYVESLGSREHRVVIRRSQSDGRMVVALWESGQPFPHAERLAEALMRGCPELGGVVRVRLPHSKRGGLKVTSISGGAYLKERIDGVVYRLPPATFVQVNASGAEALIRHVVRGSGAANGRQVYDLYGGVGVFARALLRRGAAGAVVCDADAEAVRSGKRSAAEDKIAGMRFVHRDARKFLAEARIEGLPHPDIVVANPPRSGMGAGVLKELSALSSRRLVVVSCDPATLSRDLAALGGAGWKPTKITPVDLFPQTAHVEVVAVLERAAPASS